MPTRFYIYILYSPSADRYYTGYTSNLKRRLLEHNRPKDWTSFTSHFRPWKMMAAFDCGTDSNEVEKIEQFIKDQKNRRILNQLIDPQFVPFGKLAKLVRVPHVRD